VTALEAIPRVSPDAVFLDVQMPGMTGLEVAASLPADRRPSVVFVTAYDEYALRAFEVSAVDYLVKPVTAERVERALDRLTRREDQERLGMLRQVPPTKALTRIVGRLRRELHVLPLASIEAFIVEDELVFAVTANGRYQIDRSLRELEAALDADQFARVHKSTLVNLATLRVIQPTPGGAGGVARLRNGQIVEISRRHAQALRRKLGW